MQCVADVLADSTVDMNIDTECFKSTVAGRTDLSNTEQEIIYISML